MDPTPRLKILAERFLALGETLNLSAAKDLDTLWARHILDSLALLELPEVKAAKTLLDLGSGGGFPGLPLAITRPDLAVTLLDSVAKKMAAAQTLIDEVGIPNASVRVGRAEDLGRDPALRQSWQVVVARAVAPLPTLLEYAAPLTALHGTFIAMKGPDAAEEVAAAEGARQKLRLAEPRIIPYTVGDRTFHHVVYPLKQYVPKAYPRGQGLPRKRPLGSEGAQAPQGAEGDGRARRGPPSRRKP